MNAEHLLDAIGRLDDDLVQEAERYRRPKARYGRLLGLAACFAVVITLGYVLTHVGGMGSGGAPSFSGGGNGGAPASGNSAPGGGSMLPGGYSDAALNAPQGGDSGEAAEPNAPGESEPSSPGGENTNTPLGGSTPPSDENRPSNSQEIPHGTIFLRGGTYILSGELLAELPEGGEPVLLGELLALENGSPRLSTTVEEYVGLNLWTENDGTDLPPSVYVELPAGGFARAELVQP